MIYHVYFLYLYDHDFYYQLYNGCHNFIVYRYFVLYENILYPMMSDFNIGKDFSKT